VIIKPERNPGNIGFLANGRAITFVKCGTLSPNYIKHISI
jgi:hypothetical protein